MFVPVWVFTAFGGLVVGMVFGSWLMTDSYTNPKK